MTVKGYRGEILVHSSDTGVARVTIDQDEKQVTVTAVGEVTANITIYLQKYPGVRKEITVTVSPKK